jgi:hypothetical protein
MSVRVREAVSLSLASFKYEKEKKTSIICVCICHFSLVSPLFVCLLLLVLSVIFNTYNKKGRKKNAQCCHTRVTDHLAMPLATLFVSQ